MSIWKESELEIYEEEHFFEIGYRWYTPLAIVLAIFTSIFCIFLFLWILLALSKDADLLDALFPFFHIVAGIGLAYYTLCLFFNKTFIMVENGMLHVIHQPIPWWRGNKHIPTQEIDQVFVKQKVHRRDDAPNSYSYHLFANLKNKGNTPLIRIGELSIEKAKEIESKLESYLGIVDRPMKGEFQPITEAQKNSGPRKHIEVFEDPFSTKLFTNKVNDFFLYKGKVLRIRNQLQLDWNNGNSDKILQALDKENEEYLIRFQQNKTILTSFEEKKITREKAKLLEFAEKKHKLKQVLNWKGTAFILQIQNQGKGFDTRFSRAIFSKQYLYLSSDKQKSIRVLKQGAEITYYEGKAIEKEEFSSEKLDLNEKPLIKKPQSIKREQDE